MTAPHFFAPSVAGARVTIDGEDARHAARVLRIRAGERITISDGAGTVADAVVTDAGRTLVAEVEARRMVGREPPQLVVYQGIAKAGKMETIVQKLTELGVDEIVPMAAARSVARWEGNAKVERLRAIAREAAKQSRRAWLPRVRAVTPSADARPHGLTLVLHEEADVRLSEALTEEVPDIVALVVGPEGGLSPEEVEAWRDRAGIPVTLGSQILRTETAALVAAALVLGRYGRLG